MSRTDDVINVAGHRLSTGAIEEVLAAHADVAECAVVGVADELKGELPLGLVVLKAGAAEAAKELVAELVDWCGSGSGRSRASSRRPWSSGYPRRGREDRAWDDQEDRRRGGVHGAADDRRSGDAGRDHGSTGGDRISAGTVGYRSARFIFLSSA